MSAASCSRAEMESSSDLTFNSLSELKIPVAGLPWPPRKAASDSDAKVLRTCAVKGLVDDRSAGREYEH